MKNRICLIVLLLLVIDHISAQEPVKKMDSTLKIGKVGYKIFCNNKAQDRNMLTIKPDGFDKDARQMAFYVSGRVTNAQIDDLNNDGYPDLIVFIFGDTNGVTGNVYAFASQENKSIYPFALPDIMLDPKLKEGYKGHDEFSLVEGLIVRKYPKYLPGDNKDNPTGGRRVVQYQMQRDERGGYKFKMLRFYELK